MLILDDYHVITSAAVHESVGFLVEHRPFGRGLVLASRADPPLPLARLRGRGQLTEVRAADLRFTPVEAAELLAATAGLPEASMAALMARTEGWAAGPQLAALSLRGQDDVAGFVTAFTGSHRYVLDYLTEEVLDRTGAGLRGFLLETSVPERLSAGLCQAVTGQADSQALLEQAERAGLFLIPLTGDPWLVQIGNSVFWVAYAPLIFAIAAEAEREHWFALCTTLRTAGLAAGGLIAGATVALGGRAGFIGVAAANAASFVFAAFLSARLRPGTEAPGRGTSPDAGLGAAGSRCCGTTRSWDSWRSTSALPSWRSPSPPRCRCSWSRSSAGRPGLPARPSR